MRPQYTESTMGNLGYQFLGLVIGLGLDQECRNKSPKKIAADILTLFKGEMSEIENVGSVQNFWDRMVGYLMMILEIQHPGSKFIKIDKAAMRNVLDKFYVVYQANQD